MSDLIAGLGPVAGIGRGPLSVYAVHYHEPNHLPGNLMEPIMAAGTIISVASSIPWGQVIDAAPKVADAAVRLWKSIASRRRQDSLADGTALEVDAAELNELDQLHERLATVEDRVKNLQEQLEASTELLKALAEQNTQLVNRVELNRISVKRQLVVLVGVGVAMVLAIGYLFLKQ